MDELERQRVLNMLQEELQDSNEQQKEIVGKIKKPTIFVLIFMDL